MTRRIRRPRVQGQAGVAQTSAPLRSASSKEARSCSLGPMGALACGEAPPVSLVDLRGDLLCAAIDRGDLAPGMKLTVGNYSPHVALAGASQRHIQRAHAVHAVGRNPPERHAGRGGPRHHGLRDLRLGRERSFSRHMRLDQSIPVSRSALRQVQGAVDEGVAVARNVVGDDADLAVGEARRPVVRADARRCTASSKWHPCLRCLGRKAFLGRIDTGQDCGLRAYTI